MANPGDIVFQFLSGCPDGIPLLITEIGPEEGGTLVHEANDEVGEIDLVYLWLNNTDLTTAHTAHVRILWDEGALAVSDTEIPPKSGAWLVLDGVPVANGLTVGVWCETTEIFVATGKVGRMTVTA